MTNRTHRPRHLGVVGGGRDDGRFDDGDVSLNRFGGLDPANSQTHRVITPHLLSGVTGIPLASCQEFHHVFFSLLESIGDFDGLIAAPDVYVAARGEVIEPARAWLVVHPSPSPTAVDDVDACGHGVPSVGRDVCERAVAHHSLELAAAAGSNLSLTFGSVDAVADRLIDDMREIGSSCPESDVDLLTVLGLSALGGVGPTTELIGGAQVRLLGDDVPAGRAGR